MNINLLIFIFLMIHALEGFALNIYLILKLLGLSKEDANSVSSEVVK